MNGRGLERFTGISALVVAGVTVVTMVNWGNPQLLDPISNITEYYVQGHDQALLFAFCALLWGVSLLVFGTGIRSLVYRAESDPHTLSSLAFGTSVIATIWFMLWASVNSGIAMIAGRASEGEIRLLLSLEYYVDYVNFLAAGLFMSAVSLAVLRTRVVARWLAWLGIASGALMLVGAVGLLDPIGPAGAIGDIGMLGLLLYLVWLIGMGIRLLVRPVLMPRNDAISAQAGV